MSTFSGLLVLAVFWIDMSHVYGLFYNQGAWTKKGQVAVVDFDGGFFGSSVIEAAASRNRTYGYPTYTIVPADTTTPDGIRHEVFTGKYWAALYASPGATDRFQAAIGDTANEQYDPAGAVAYVTMTARYFAFYEFNIFVSSLTVMSIATSIIRQRAVAVVFSPEATTSTTLSQNALATLGDPAQPVEIPAAYANFSLADDRVFVNTIGTIMPVLMQFFFLMALNGISNNMHIFAKRRTRDHVRSRATCAIIWPAITSLCTTSWTFIFMRSYPFNAGQFFGIWGISYLYEAITFDRE